MTVTHFGFRLHRAKLMEYHQFNEIVVHTYIKTFFMNCEHKVGYLIQSGIHITVGLELYNL